MVMLELKLEDQPPLIQAIFSGDIEDIRSLLESKPDVNYQDAEKRSPLHAAAYRGDKELAELLLEQGARVNTKDSKWLTPLHRACGVCADDMVELLLRHQADTTARDRQWQTPLHIAAAHNALGCLHHLLGYISNVNVTDRSGCTALHHAALNGHNEVVELLLSRGSIVNACDKKDCRPLHWAAHLGHVDTVNILIQRGADINAKDRNQYTPLHAAVASGMVYVCSLLLNAGADVNAQNAFGNTPLHIACLNGHLPVSQILLAHNADLEASNYKGQTALHIAAASTQGVGCLAYLLEQEKIDINRQSADGRTPLHMSAIYGRFTRSKRLIDKGAVIDCADKNGNTALHIAAQYGHDILTATLLEYGADATKRGFEGRTPLHVCCLSGFVEVCRKFLQSKIDLNIVDDHGRTLIHCAAYKGSVECLDLLVSQGANFKLQDAIGRTALHYAAVRGHYNCVYTLVGIGSPVNVLDLEGCSALHLAAAYDTDAKCVEYLLQHKADPLLKDVNGFTPVHYAVNGSNLASLELLLQVIGKNVNFLEPGMPETTPLHLAARHADLNILRAVILYFPETNIKTKEGYTPLLIAAREGHTPNVQMLLRYGAKVAVTDDVTGMSPVHYSAKNGHLHCLALLIDNTEVKSVIDTQDKWKRTALMLAISGAHLDCVFALLKSNSDPNIVDADLHSSLFRAVVTDQNNVVYMLIESGGDLRAADVNGKTVLHLAAACGHLKCLQNIVQSVGENDALVLDKNGFSALHWACYYGNANCLDYLLQRNIFLILEGNPFTPVHCAAFTGSERCLELLHSKFSVECIQAKDTRNRTPLHLAAWHGHADCVRFLLDNGGDVDARDEILRSALISAAQNGQSQVIDLLLAHKADLKAADVNGNTALHVACLRKHNHTALLLLEYINDTDIINMIDNDKKTALHLAARNGLVEVTAELIKKGASVIATDNNGLTPALYCAPNACVAQCLAIILANHPNEYPAGPQHTKECMKLLRKLSHPLRRETILRMTQTEMSLLRNPDELSLQTDEERCRSASKKHHSPRAQSLNLRLASRLLKRSNSGIDVHGMDHRMTNTKNLILIENYDKQDFDVSKFRNTKGGLGLHRSFSEMTLAQKRNTGDNSLEDSEEENAEMWESTCQRLIDGYKSIALKMADISNTYDVSIDDIQKAFIQHYAKRKCKRWQKYKAHMKGLSACERYLNEVNTTKQNGIETVAIPIVVDDSSKTKLNNKEKFISFDLSQLRHSQESIHQCTLPSRSNEKKITIISSVPNFKSRIGRYIKEEKDSESNSKSDSIIDSKDTCALKRTHSSRSGITMALQTSSEDDNLTGDTRHIEHYCTWGYHIFPSSIKTFCDCQYVCSKCVLKNRFDYTHLMHQPLTRSTSLLQFDEDDELTKPYHFLRYLDQVRSIQSQYPENPEDGDNEPVFIPLENLTVLEPRVFVGEGAIKKTKFQRHNSITQGTTSMDDNNGSRSTTAGNDENIPEIDSEAVDTATDTNSSNDTSNDPWPKVVFDADCMKMDIGSEIVAKPTTITPVDVVPEPEGRSRRRKRRPLGNSVSLTNVSVAKPASKKSSVASTTEVPFDSGPMNDLLDAATIPPVCSSRFRIERVFDTQYARDVDPIKSTPKAEKEKFVEPNDLPVEVVSPGVVFEEGETFWGTFTKTDEETQSTSESTSSTTKPSWSSKKKSIHDIPPSLLAPSSVHSKSSTSSHSDSTLPSSLASLEFKPHKLLQSHAHVLKHKNKKLVQAHTPSPPSTVSSQGEELFSAIQRAHEKMKHLTYQEFIALSKNLNMSKEARAMAQRFIEQLAQQQDEAPHRVESKHALLEGVHGANSADSGLDTASLDSLSAEDECEQKPDLEEVHQSNSHESFLNDSKKQRKEAEEQAERRRLHMPYYMPMTTNSTIQAAAHNLHNQHRSWESTAREEDAGSYDGSDNEFY